MDSPDFCAQFVEAAHCHCKSHFPKNPEYCDSLTMVNLYNLMIAATREKTLEAGCRKQQDVSYDICIKHWPYYFDHCPHI